MAVMQRSVEQPEKQEADDDVVISAAPPTDWQAYRTVSRSAVVAVVVGFLGLLLGMMFPQMLVLCFAGFFAGIVGYRSVVKHPLEYTGKGIAVGGMVLSVAGLILGIAVHTYIYYTEMPEGNFERVSFYELQPDNPDLKDVILPERVLELNGKEIFIKGYVHPGVQDQGKVKHFILVPDMGTCCFGGQPKITDMMEVRVQTEPGVRWSPSLRKLAGTFQLHPPRQVSKLSDVIFSLDATYVK